MELANVALNKNTVPGDKSAMTPGGIRMGSPAMTTRGLVEADFETVASFVHRGIEIALSVQKLAGSTKMVDFREALAKSNNNDISKLKTDVTTFCRKFPTVGFQESEMKYL